MQLATVKISSTFCLIGDQWLGGLSIIYAASMPVACNINMPVTLCLLYSTADMPMNTS